MTDTATRPIPRPAPPPDEPLNIYAFANVVAKRDRVLRPINARIEKVRQTLRAIDHDGKVAQDQIARDADESLRVLMQSRYDEGEWLAATADVFRQRATRAAVAKQEWQERRAPVALQLKALEASLALHASALPALGGAR